MDWNTVHSSLLAAVCSLVLGLAAVGIPTDGHAQESTAGATGGPSGIGAGQIGLGLGKGTLASGLTGKFYMSPGTALQAHAGYTAGWGWGSCRGGRGRYDYDCGSYYGFGLNVDMLGNVAHLVNASAGRLSVNVGGGGALSSGGPFGTGLFAANGVAELGWHFSAVPVELAADWRPFIGFGSGGAFFSLFDFGFSARWYF